MPVKSLSKDKKKKQDELRQQMLTAIQSDDEGAIAEALCVMANSIQNDILDEARSVAQSEGADRYIMAQRGQHQLTTEERSYYGQVIENRGFEGLEATTPPTIFNRVFEDLQTDHPILSEIDFIPTGLVTEWIVRTSEKVGAVWGKITSAITEELGATFGVEDADQYKLTAFFPVAKDMLELGAEWLDKFVRAVLKESIQISLENAIINGDGKDKPIGMIRDLEGSVQLGVYPELAAEVLNDLTPGTLGEKVMAPLTDGGTKAVDRVIMVVNPLDYWAKIFAKTTMLTSTGSYVYGVLPIPGTIIQSIAMPVGKMSVGRPKDYMLLLGGAERIMQSDEYKFLEDQRVYATKMFANGKPKRANAFKLFNISGMNGASQVLAVESKGTDALELEKEGLKGKGKNK